MIGFYLPNQDNLNILMLLRIARLSEDLGLNFSIASGIKLNDNYMPERFITKIKCLNEATLSGWLDKLSFLVVPATCPDKVISLSQSKRLSLIMVIDWNSPIYSLKNNLSAADYVVCHSWNICRSLKEMWGIKTTRYIPWDSGFPITKRHLEPKPTRILLPISTSDKELSVFETTELAERLLKKNIEVTIKVTTSKTLSRKANKLIRNLVENSNKRLSFCNTSSIAQWTRTFTDSDLLVSPHSQSSMYGTMTPLLGLSLGLPLICPDSSVMQELVTTGRNGVLVPTNTRELSTNISNFEKAVIKIFSQKNTTRKLRLNSTLRLAERNEMFVKGWKELWSL